MLILPIKKKWFDMIKSGEKKEEYREIKPYWTSRFKSYVGDIGNYKTFKYRGGIGFTSIEDEIIFRNGYSKTSPTVKCKVRLKKGQGKKEWGAEPGKEYYILEIIRII